MIKSLREVILFTGCMDSTLVGVDGSGRFHVVGETPDPGRRPTVLFMTFSPEGILERSEERSLAEVILITGEDPIWDNMGWPLLQKQLGVFPAQGEMYYEMGPPTIPYFQPKYTDYLYEGPLDLVEAQAFLSDLIRVGPGEVDAIIEQANYINELDEFIDCDGDFNYKTVFGYGADGIIAGAKLAPDLFVMVRSRKYLLETEQRERIVMDLNSLEAVLETGPDSYNVITLPWMDHPWIHHVDAMIKTKSGLYARDYGFDEFYDLQITELEFDEKALRKALAAPSAARAVPA